MPLLDLMSSIQLLSRGEKLQLIQLLAADIAQRIEPGDCENVPTVAIWSPFDAYEGAATLLEVLKDAEGAN
jgi:hypothetical protein